MPLVVLLCTRNSARLLNFSVMLFRFYGLKRDLKSADRKVVGVQVPLRAPTFQTALSSVSDSYEEATQKEPIPYIVFSCLSLPLVLIGGQVGRILVLNSQVDAAYPLLLIPHWLIVENRRSCLLLAFSIFLEAVS
jgi:hypothetical protein